MPSDANRIPDWADKSLSSGLPVLRARGENQDLVIPIAERYGDVDLRRKAGVLEERLRTGEIPDYMAGER